MLLEMDNMKLILLLESPAYLAAKVEEAVQISIEPSKYFDLKVFTRLSDFKDRSNCDHDERRIYEGYDE
ncbi:polyadenylate-binding protein 7 [Tanacetum coccineum]